jgi:hypothetical protein
VASVESRHVRPRPDQIADALAGDDVRAVAQQQLEQLQRLGSDPARLSAAPAGAPVMVAFCVKPGSEAATAEAQAPCTVKAPPRERSLLEAIDKAVLTHDRNARKALART